MAPMDGIKNKCWDEFAPFCIVFVIGGVITFAGATNLGPSSSGMAISAVVFLGVITLTLVGIVSLPTLYQLTMGLLFPIWFLYRWWQHKAPFRTMRRWLHRQLSTYHRAGNSTTLAALVGVWLVTCVFGLTVSQLFSKVGPLIAYEEGVKQVQRDVGYLVYSHTGRDVHYFSGGKLQTVHLAWVTVRVIYDHDVGIHFRQRPVTFIRGDDLTRPELVTYIFE